MAPGVQADITFAGVNINGQFSMDIATNSTVSDNETAEVSEADVVNKTYVHLTLADGTTNTLRNSAYTTKDPGTNTAASYQFLGLRCGEGSDLASSLSNLESANPCVLWVYSGVRSAAIGGHAGGGTTITFNGGYVKAQGYYHSNAFGQGCGGTPNYNAHLESWELLLDKYPTDPPCGAPASFLEGQLYLWLPTTTLPM